MFNWPWRVGDSLIVVLLDQCQDMFPHGRGEGFTPLDHQIKRVQFPSYPEFRIVDKYSQSTRKRMVGNRSSFEDSRLVRKNSNY